MDNNANNMYDSIIAGYENETEAVHNDAEETASTEKREPWVRNYTEEQRQDMARRKAAGELLPGHKRRKTIYHRTKFGQQDFFVLRFLLFARQASAPQIGFMLNRTQNTAYRRLLGLNEVKLVTKEVVCGYGTLWKITNEGRSLLDLNGWLRDSDPRAPKTDSMRLDELKHSLAINQVMATIARGVPNPLGTEVRDLPRGINAFDVFVSEAEIKRDWLTATAGRQSKLMSSPGRVGHAVQKRALAEAESGARAWDELLENFPSLWTLTPEPSLVSEGRAGYFQRPDLVLNLEHERSSQQPVSIAVEVELSTKTLHEYRKILTAYKQDRYVYSRLVYAFTEERIKRRVVMAANDVGLNETKLSFARLRGSDGALIDGRFRIP